MNIPHIKIIWTKPKRSRTNDDMLEYMHKGVFEGKHRAVIIQFAHEIIGHILYETDITFLSYINKYSLEAWMIYSIYPTVKNSVLGKVKFKKSKLEKAYLTTDQVFTIKILRELISTVYKREIITGDTTVQWLGDLMKDIKNQLEILKSKDLPIVDIQFS